MASFPPPTLNRKLIVITSRVIYEIRDGTHFGF